jgi:hypothetical protein
MRLDGARRARCCSALRARAKRWVSRWRLTGLWLFGMVKAEINRPAHFCPAPTPIFKELPRDKI